MSKSVDSPVTRREEATARRAHRDVHEAERRAVQAAFAAAKEKSESHNDLITAMERQAAAFVPRTEYDTLAERLRLLDLALTSLRSTLSAVVAIAAIAVPLLSVGMNIVFHFLGS